MGDVWVAGICVASFILGAVVVYWSFRPIQQAQLANIGMLRGLVVSLERRVSEGVERTMALSIARVDPGSGRLLVGAVSQDISNRRLVEAQEAVIRAAHTATGGPDDSGDTDDNEGVPELTNPPSNVVDDDRIASDMATIFSS